MKVARENDLVFLMGKDRKSFIVRLEPGAQLHIHRGVIRHDDLIGQPLGREVQSHLGYYLLVLEPSTHDLILDLKRTTQIMYPKDIGYLLLKMNVGSGSRVVEAGAGSGGLTLALARAVMPIPFVELKERDIEEGFDEVDADALFLDLRNPWEYLAQAHAALKGGGFFGATLPTTNQVVRLIRALPEHGFSAVEVEESCCCAATRLSQPACGPWIEWWPTQAISFLLAR